MVSPDFPDFGFPVVLCLHLYHCIDLQSYRSYEKAFWGNSINEKLILEIEPNAVGIL
jgi:hypothetical protein